MLKLTIHIITQEHILFTVQLYKNWFLRELHNEQKAVSVTIMHTAKSVHQVVARGEGRGGTCKSDSGQVLWVTPLVDFHFSAQWADHGEHLSGSTKVGRRSWSTSLFCWYA